MVMNRSICDQVWDMPHHYVSCTGERSIPDIEETPELHDRIPLIVERKAPLLPMRHPNI